MHKMQVRAFEFDCARKQQYADMETQLRCDIERLERRYRCESDRAEGLAASEAMNAKVDGERIAKFFKRNVAMKLVVMAAIADHLPNSPLEYDIDTYREWEKENARAEAEAEWEGENNYPNP